jgi:hypothetical protein
VSGSLRPLSAEALELLFAIRRADEDHGGLFRREMTDEEARLADELVERGLAEVLTEYGEAPDGEEDERVAGGALGYRITGRGVEAIQT